MGGGARRLRRHLRGVRGLGGRGRSARRHPAGRPARAGLPAAADRNREGPVGADRGARRLELASPAQLLLVCRHAMNDSSSRPLRLLLSDFARKSWGARIEAAVPAGSLSFVTAEEARAAGGACDADIAFMTREVTGKSTSNNPTPELAGFDKVVRATPTLKWLQIHPAGAERSIYRELRGRGVKVTTASGATAVTVSHSVLGALIAINRRFPLLADAQRRHAWEPRLGERSPRDLKGQCAVIVGMGPIGRNIAALLKMLGMTSIGVRRTAEPAAGFERVIAYADLPTVLPRADWLILCCPAS